MKNKIKKSTICISNEEMERLAMEMFDVVDRNQKNKTIMSNEKRMVRIIRANKHNDSLYRKKTGRNSLCKCGSGKKAKRCCGNETQYYSRSNKR